MLYPSTVILWESCRAFYSSGVNFLYSSGDRHPPFLAGSGSNPACALAMCVIIEVLKHQPLVVVLSCFFFVHRVAGYLVQPQTSCIFYACLSANIHKQNSKLLLTHAFPPSLQHFNTMSGFCLHNPDRIPYLQNVMKNTGHKVNASLFIKQHDNLCWCLMFVLSLGISSVILFIQQLCSTKNWMRCVCTLFICN